VTDAVTFTFLGQSFLMLVEAFGGDAGISERVRTGDIVTDLYRPVDVQGYYLAQDVGRAGFVAFARGLPPFVIGGLCFHLRTPTDPTVMVAFTVSVLLALLVSFGLRFLVGLSAFWTLDSGGTLALTNVLTIFFSGAIIPIVFFPQWLEAVARALPFAAILQVPLEIFLGKHHGGGLWSVLAIQAAWAAALVAAGRVALSAATRKMVVQGG
jgi:ABC-2 type transport system permease protein